MIASQFFCSQTVVVDTEADMKVKSFEDTKVGMKLRKSTVSWR